MLKINLNVNAQLKSVEAIANYLSQNGLHLHFDMLNVIDNAYQSTGTNYDAIEMANPRVGYVVWEDDQGKTLEVRVKIPSLVKVIQLELKSRMAYASRKNKAANYQTSPALAMDDFINMSPEDKDYYISSGDLLLPHSGVTVAPDFVFCPYNEYHPFVRKLWQTGMLGSFLFLHLR